MSHLDISYSNVSLESVETFTNVIALERLDLRYNKLRTVYINILTALLKLSGMCLYGNWLQCDCQLQEVWRWCKDRNIATGYGGEVPECDRRWGKVLECDRGWGKVPECDREWGKGTGM
jgi:hypothetical protein